MDETKETTEIALVAREPADIFKIAVDTGQKLAEAKEFLELQERYDAIQARKAFHKAMAAFKKEPPQIEKDKTVEYKQTRYKHASLANVTQKINTALSAQGLSAAWITSQDNGNITVACTITHELGHSESTELTAAPDTSGAKNAIQAIGSTVSYLQRYTILALTGLATSDMDDDGKTGGGKVEEFITEEQVKKLTKDINKFYTDGGQEFLKHLGAETVDTIYAGEQYNKAKGWIRDMKTKAKKIGRAPGEDG